MSKVSLLDRRQRVLDARHDRRHLVAEVRQHVLEQHADQHLVLDHEHATLGGVWGGSVMLLGFHSIDRRKSGC